jgi:hypothetical protein
MRCPSYLGRLGCNRSECIDEARRDWQWDITTDTVTWSERLYGIAGCDPSNVPPPIRGHSRFYSSGSWGKLIAALLRDYPAALPYEIELQTVRRDGMSRRIVSVDGAACAMSDTIPSSVWLGREINWYEVSQLVCVQPTLSKARDARRRMAERLIDT